MSDSVPTVPENVVSASFSMDPLAGVVFSTLLLTGTVLTTINAVKAVKSVWYNGF